MKSAKETCIPLLREPINKCLINFGSLLVTAPWSNDKEVSGNKTAFFFLERKATFMNCPKPLTVVWTYAEGGCRAGSRIPSGKWFSMAMDGARVICFFNKSPYFSVWEWKGIEKLAGVTSHIQSKQFTNKHSLLQEFLKDHVLRSFALGANAEIHSRPSRQRAFN